MAETVADQATNGTVSAASGLVERLSERIGTQARAATIYGEPIDREGVTVIPVARACWGVGGGAGSGPDHETGSGGGGGINVSPVGYIEIKGGSSTYRPIFKPPIGLIAVAVGIALGIGILRARCRASAPGPPP